MRNRVIVPARQATQAGGIHSFESILGLHKRLKIRALYSICSEVSRRWALDTDTGYKGLFFLYTLLKERKKIYADPHKKEYERHTN